MEDALLGCRTCDYLANKVVKTLYYGTFSPIFLGTEGKTEFSISYLYLQKIMKLNNSIMISFNAKSF